MKRLTLVVLTANNEHLRTEMELPSTSPLGDCDQTVVIEEKDFGEVETGVRELGDALRLLRQSKAS